MTIMNFLIVILYLCPFFLFGSSLDRQDDFWKISFRLWQLRYGKIYADEIEEVLRFSVFKENAKAVQSLNEEYADTHFEVNQFADMSPSEFSSTVLMRSKKPPIFEGNRYAATPDAEYIPESFDWTEKNVVTSVKNQGSVGTCWAFSTIGNIESQYALLPNMKLTNLSVEQVVDCDGSEDIKEGHADCGVFGGWPYLAYHYIQSAGGLEDEKDYKYCSGVDPPNLCSICPAPGFNASLCGPPVPYCKMDVSCAAKLNRTKFVPNLRVQDWQAFGTNETEMAAHLMTVGPLSVCLNAQLLQFYSSGVFNPPDFVCNPEKINHAVLLVGWGTEKGYFSDTPYWKVKNSWGESWGEKGYFRIKRGSGKCGINTQVTSAILQH